MTSSSTSSTLSKNEILAMNLSLGIGLCMLGIKWYAYFITGSVAIFSDAMESVVHQLAVAFAFYSLRVTYRPPDHDHNYGHDKITYFSAGLEGGLIIIAAIVIIGTAIKKMIVGVTLEQLGTGTLLTALAGGINAVLGFYLVKVGKKEKSLIVEANGRHILTDAWTSVGAVIGLSLAAYTGYSIIDPILALLFGSNIIWEGYKLMRSAVGGLMDKSNPEFFNKAESALNEYTTNTGTTFHRLRLRESGNRVYVDFHIVFQDGTMIEDAHRLATEAELCVATAIDHACDITSHLESTDLPEGHID
ncbi:MAG: cation diffusion facilitator family transporter [Candidatus Kapaibacterium sp.]|nr:cation diffusion facilitator family transporter [Bacteroidota bacterium]